MSRDVDALYERFALPPSDATDTASARAALTPLLAANLDGFVFRRELIHFAGALDAVRDRFAESQQWNEKLERDIAELKGEIERVAAANRRLDDANRGLADPKAAFDLLPELVQKYLLKRVFRARR